MKFYKKPVFIVAATVLALAAGAYFYFSAGKDGGPEYVEVAKGDIIQVVSVTGKVKPVRDVSLAFEKSGRITSVNARVGDFVYAGDALARQDSSELFAQLEKAKADSASQRATLDKSRVVLANYYSGIINILNDAYIKADDAVRKQAGAMFTDAESDTPKLSFSSTNSQAVTDAQNGRLASRTELNAWRQELNALSAASGGADLSAALVKSKSRLAVIGAFLVNVSDALEKATGLSQTTLDSYKAGITTARTNVNTALTSISDRQQNIDSQKATIASEEAAVKSYEASVQNIEAQIAKTVLRSPISGVVTKQDAKAGEIASAGTGLVSVISASQFEMEANIPEVDIAGVKTGNTADVTLDAYGSDVIFKAKVTAIDPAETVIEGVATYKVTLQFLEKDDRVKSGMTANIDILKQEKSGVLILPQRLVSQRNGDRFVTILENGQTGEINVIVGLRGSNGNVEIVEGVKEGDKVIISNSK